jgi:hypothetical protein
MKLHTINVSFSSTMGPCGDRKYFMITRVGHHGGRGGQENTT